MTNYFTIGSSTDLTVIGYYPQTKSRLQYNPEKENSYRKVDRHEFPGFTPNYEVEISFRAKPTNFINRSPLTFGFLIDENFLDTLNKFNLPPFRTYDVDVYHKKKILRYYWFHFIFDMWKYLDPEKSKATFHHKVSDKIISEHSFISKENLLTLARSTNFEKGILLKEVVFKSAAELPDLIEITEGFNIPLISERLKNALESAGMTGFVSRKFDRISFEN